MNIITLASDLSKILQEQISILNSIVSLNSSLKKLLAQKGLTEKWDDSELSQRPWFLFTESIECKAKMIRAELKSLR